MSTLRKNYLEINVFSNLVVMGQEKNPYNLQKKAIRVVTNKVVKEMAD